MSEIWVIAPGGRSSTGGICRMVDNAATEWERSRPPMRIIDSGGMAGRARMMVGFASALLAVARGCLRGRVGLLHVHVAANGSIARKAPFVLLGRACGLPVVLHLHGADFEAFHARIGGLGRHLVRTVFGAASAVVVLGARARAHMIARVGIDAQRVHVLPNAVADLPPAERAADACCRLLFLGALSERKGVPELLAALARPSLAGLDWRLDMVGNGDASRWRTTAERLGLAGRARLLGWMSSEQARARLADADLLVLPSRQEGLPMAILEAMAAGVAVVATDVGDVGEAVIEGQTGALVPAGDPAGLADALSRLIGSRELRERLGRGGRARFEALFEISAYVERLAAIFRCATAAVGDGSPTPTPARTGTP